MKKLCIMLLVLALTFGLVACGTKPANDPQAEVPTQATENGQGDPTPTEPTDPTDPTKPTDPTEPTVPVVPDPVPTPTPGGNGGNTGNTGGNTGSNTGGNTGSTAPSQPQEPVDPNVYTGVYSGCDAEIDLNEGKNTFSNFLREEVSAEDLAQAGLSGTITLTEKMSVSFPNVTVDGDQVTMSGTISKSTSTLTVEGPSAAGYKTLVLATLEELHEADQIPQSYYERYKALYSGEVYEEETTGNDITLLAKLDKSNQTFQLISVEVLYEEGSSTSTFEYKDGALYKEITLYVADWGASYDVTTYYPDGKTTHITESYEAEQSGDEYVPGNLRYRYEYHENGNPKKDTHYFEDGTVSSEHEYSEEGNSIRDTYYYENGNLESEYIYNEDGEELSFKCYDEEGNLLHSRESEFNGDERIDREYDDQNRLVFISYYKFNGTEYEYVKHIEYSYSSSGTIYTYEHDLNGLRKESCVLHTEDTKEYLYTWTWTYDEEGNATLTLADTEDTFNENGDPVKEFTHFVGYEDFRPEVDLYTYNEKGDLIRQAYYDCFGYCMTFTTYEYTYGPDGKPLSFICRDDRGLVRYTRTFNADGTYTDTYTYDNGDPRTTYQIFPNGDEIITEYNEDGTVWYVAHMKADGTYTETYKYSDGSYAIDYWDEDTQLKHEDYDENGKLTSTIEYFEDKIIRTEYREDGSIDSLYEYTTNWVCRKYTFFYANGSYLLITYDEEGDPVREEQYRANGFCWERVEHAGDGSYTDTHYNDDGSIWTIDEYDTTGTLFKSTYYADDRSYTVYGYDAEGNLISTDHYDQYGNPI